MFPFPIGFSKDFPRKFPIKVFPNGLVLQAMDSRDKASMAFHAAGSPREIFLGLSPGRGSIRGTIFSDKAIYTLWSIHIDP